MRFDADPLSPRNLAAYRRSLARVRRVMAGETPPPLTSRTSKVLRILTSRETDAEMSAVAFLVRLSHEGHRPNLYYLTDAPAVVGFLVRAGTVTRVGRRLVIDVPARVIPACHDDPSWRLEACSVWLEDDGTLVCLSIRPTRASRVSTTWPTPHSLERPAPVVRWRELPVPVVCPHCTVRVSAARDLGEALVCPACARSFASP